MSYIVKSELIMRQSQKNLFQFKMLSENLHTFNIVQNAKSEV